MNVTPTNPPPAALSARSDTYRPEQLQVITDRKAECPPRFTCAKGAMRRLRALAAAGWPLLPVHRLTDIPLEVLLVIRGGNAQSGVQPRWIHEDLAYEIREAYDLISSLDPAQVLPDTTAARVAIEAARANAVRRRWKALPHDWEGLDMDDPKELITRGIRVVETPVRRRDRLTTTADEIVSLVRAGAPMDTVREVWSCAPATEREDAVHALCGIYTRPEAAERLGYTVRALDRLHARARARYTATHTAHTATHTTHTAHTAHSADNPDDTGDAGDPAVQVGAA